MTYRVTLAALTAIIVAGVVALPLAWPAAPATKSSNTCHTDTVALASSPTTMTITACPTHQE